MSIGVIYLQTIKQYLTRVCSGPVIWNKAVSNSTRGCSNIQGQNNHVSKLVVSWHSINSQLVVNWHSIGSELAFYWHSIEIPFVLHLYSIDTPLVVNWFSIGSQLVVNWHSIGILLAFYWKSIDTPFVFHWHSIATPLEVNWYSIGCQLVTYISKQSNIILTRCCSGPVIWNKAVSNPTRGCSNIQGQNNHVSKLVVNWHSLCSQLVFNL